MSLKLQELVLLGLLSASIHWIIARSLIMRWFWGRTRGWLAKLLACPACSGWWISIGLGALGLLPVQVSTTFGPNTLPNLALAVLLAGASGTFLTPVFEAVLLWGLAVSGIPLDPPAPPEPEELCARSEG